MEETIEHAEGPKVSPSIQRLKSVRELGIADDSNSAPLQGVKWVELIFRGPCPEMRAVLHVWSDLCLIKHKSLTWREVPSSSVQDAQFVARQFGLVYQMTRNDLESKDVIAIGL